MTREQAWKSYAERNSITPDEIYSYDKQRHAFLFGWDAREAALADAHPPPDSILWTDGGPLLVDHKIHRTTVSEARGSWHAKCECGWVDKHDWDKEGDALYVAEEHMAHVRRLGEEQADAYRGIAGGDALDRALGEGRR